MNLYLISQTVNNKYDTYDKVVVAAKNEDMAKTIEPDTCGEQTWCKPEFVQVELIGKAIKGTKEGIILASFNAG